MKKQNHPNLLLIITDQERKIQHFPEGWEEKNLYYMTLLKKHGIDFQQAQCNSCMCTPSRSVLFTGKYPSETGMTATLSFGGPQSPAEPQLDTTIPNMATMLNKVYDVQYRGKWHLSKGRIGENSLTQAEIALYGFMGWIPPDAGEDSKNVNFGGGYANHDFNYVNQAIDYVKNWEARKARGENPKPFFLVLSLVNPHDVLAYPTDFMYGYKDKDLVGDIELPPSWDENLLTNYKPEAHSQLKSVMKVALGGLPYVSQKRNYINFYGNLMKKIDGEIGRLIDLFYPPKQTLKRGYEVSDLAKNTWIVRTSDHGELGMAHGGMRQKAFNVYEETLRVPLVFSNPSYFKKGEVSDELMGLVDVMPTVASLLDMTDEKPKGLRGVDMSSVILGKKGSFKSQDGVLFTFDDTKAGSAYNPSSVDAPNRIRCVRTKRFKYARYFIAEGTYADEFEMYDLKNDPNELQNVGNPNHPDYKKYAKEREKLEKLLHQLEREKMRLPAMRVRVAAGLKASGGFKPRLTPIFTDQGVAYQIGVHYITGWPTEEGIASIQNQSIQTLINVAKRNYSQKVINHLADVGITYKHIPVAGSANQKIFNEQTDQVVKAMNESNLPVLVFDEDSDVSGAMWAAYLAKTEAFDTNEAIERGFQVGLRHKATIKRLKKYL